MLATALQATAKPTADGIKKKARHSVRHHHRVCCDITVYLAGEHR